jgi:hypothetical protein
MEDSFKNPENQMLNELIVPPVRQVEMEVKILERNKKSAKSNANTATKQHHIPNNKDTQTVKRCV